MRWLSTAGRVAGGVLLLVILVISLASWPTAFLDRSPNGTVRLSFFPLVLAIFDPFVWTCVRNSLIIAGLVAVGSLAIGVGLASVGSFCQYRGRSLLWAVAMVPLAVEPLLLAPGISIALGGPRSWDWLAARSFAGYPLDEVTRWAALIWLGLASGAPIVALTTSATLRKIRPAWIEAARAAGASRAQVWSEIIWPILRPVAALACASVFTLTLVEPAGPLILGLNRTLARSILDAATRLDQPTRASALALLTIALALSGRTLIRWWGGPTLPGSAPSESPQLERASFRRAWFCRMILLAWVAFAVGPLGLLLFRSFQSLRDFASEAGMNLGKALIHDPEVGRWITNTATNAGLVVLIDLVILRALVGRRKNPDQPELVFISKLLQAIPPLALGVGAFASPWLLETLGDSMGGLPSDWLRRLVLELNPARSPGSLLILVVAAGKLPILIKVANLTRSEVQPRLIEASKLMGISDQKSVSAGQGRWLGFVPGRAAILVFALASTNLASALLLTPFSERRTVAPAILLSIIRESSIDPRIAGLIVLVLVGKLIAFSLAARTRSVSLGDWFRG